MSVPHVRPAAHRGAAAVAVAALLAGGLALAGAAAHRTALAPVAAAAQRGELQRDFAAAAAEFHVPQRVLMAVAYQETLWETHGGRPSVTGNYNVMALTQVGPQAFRAAAGPETADGRGTEPAARRGVPAREQNALRAALSPARQAASPALHTLDRAAALIHADPATLRTDPRQSIRGAAALLAQYERATRRSLPRDASAWYGAVARYSQAATPAAADQFADRVYATIRDGASRVTADGQVVVLSAESDVPVPPPSPAPAPDSAPKAECPAGLACSFVPAAYALPPGTKDPTAYGNYDLAHRPADGRIRWIVIHDTEATLAASIAAFRSPADQASAHYIIGQDGSVTQMVPLEDIAWHSGNRSVNAHSVGIEHEGYGLQVGSWYTEQEYRSSAELVAFLARKYHIPLDRDHLIGHDDVPGQLDRYLAGMHWDPGVYWDWQHYLALVGAPLTGRHRMPRPGETATIAPPYSSGYEPLVTGCGSVTGVCVPRPVNFVYLRTAPADNAPLLPDNLLPSTKSATTAGFDWSDKAVAGQRFVVAAVRGPWVAIWYGGREGWFRDPGGRFTLVDGASRLVVTPAGNGGAPVFGRIFPEPSAYPPALHSVGSSAANRIVPLGYTIPAGQRYTASAPIHGDFYYAEDINCSAKPDCLLVTGKTRYYEIRFNHRVAFVRASDVKALRSAR